METNTKQKITLFFNSKFLFLFYILIFSVMQVKAGGEEEILFPSMNVKFVYNGRIKDKQTDEKTSFRYTLVREKTESGTYDDGGYYTTEEYYDEYWDEYFEDYVYVPNYKKYSYTRLLERIDISYEAFPKPEKDGNVLPYVKENAQSICKDIYNNLKTVSSQQNTVYSSGYSRFKLGEKDLKKLSIDYENSVINYSEIYGFTMDGADVLAHIQVSYILEKGVVIGRAIKIHTSLNTSGNSNEMTAYVCSMVSANPYNVNVPIFKLSFDLPHNFLVLRYLEDTMPIVVKYGEAEIGDWKDMIAGNDFLIHDLGELKPGDKMEDVYYSVFGFKQGDDPFYKDTYWQKQLESTYNMVGRNPNINYVGYASFQKTNDASNSGGIKYVLFQFYNHIYAFEYLEDIGPSLQVYKFIELAMIFKSMKKL